MKKTMLTCDTLDRFEKFINPETLTAEQVQEVEHLAYCANMGAESKESAWTRFCELVKHFLSSTMTVTRIPATNGLIYIMLPPQWLWL